MTMFKAPQLVATLCRKLGIHRGAPRVWLEGILPARAGFTPGARYSVSVPDGDNRVVLKIEANGIRMVSSKTKGDRELPVIDINSRELLSRFDGMNAVRVVLRENEIHILPDAVEVKIADRTKRLEEAVAAGAISVASISHGIGVLSHAMHQGLQDAGLATKLVWACDIREDVLEHAAKVNDAWDTDTAALAVPVQQLAFADEYTLGRLAKPVILEAGLPCTAASIAGRSKKGLSKAEDDEVAGHLVAAFIAIIARVNPSVVLLENVRPWFATASASILRTSLKEFGYEVQERSIDGAEYAIEARPRQVLLAVTRGVEIDLAQMVAPTRVVKTVGEILEPVPDDDASWSAMSYLREKEVFDKMNGKGFAMQVISPDDTRVGTCGTGYAKNRSTEPKLKHPSNPDLLRLFTPVEHARLKGIPENLIAGIESKTFAHQVLGQSVIWPAFRALGRQIGDALLGYTSPCVVDRFEDLPLFAA